MRTGHCAALLCCLLFGNAAAQSFLPPRELVDAALDQHPLVLKGVADLDVARARNDMLHAGPYELTATAEYARRSVDRGGDFDEWQASLSRTVRLPGKTRLDREAGALGIVRSQNAAADARHQAALQLKRYWLTWLNAAERGAVASAQLDNRARDLAIAERRHALREGSALEIDLVRAAHAEAEATVAIIEGEVATARAVLASMFPQLTLPHVPPRLPSPAVAEGDLRRWQAQIVSRSHELKVATAEADRLQALQERASRDRVPDPTIGVRAFREFGGIETGFGVFMSVPFGGRARAAATEASSAAAARAVAQAHLVRLQVEETAVRDATAAEAAIAAAQAARSALVSSDAALTRAKRGYEFGHFSLQEYLLAARQHFSVTETEIAARHAAHDAVIQLRIDAHDLWLTHEEEPHTRP